MTSFDLNSWGRFPCRENIKVLSKHKSGSLHLSLSTGCHLLSGHFATTQSQIYVQLLITHNIRENKKKNKSHAQDATATSNYQMLTHPWATTTTLFSCVPTAEWCTSIMITHHNMSTYPSLLETSGSFLIMVSLMTWSRIDFGSSTGSSKVLPRCWLYCKHHASPWPLLQYWWIVSWLNRNHTPSSLWILNTLWEI